MRISCRFIAASSALLTTELLYIEAAIILATSSTPSPT